MKRRELTIMMPVCVEAYVSEEDGEEYIGRVVTPSFECALQYYRIHLLETGEESLISDASKKDFSLSRHKPLD